MARIAWACWDGGGNLPPSLGIAQDLLGRGHQVRFYGRPDMVTRAKAAGLDATPLQQAVAAEERHGPEPAGILLGYIASSLVGDELTDIFAADRPDVIVIDAMFGGALGAADRFPAPTVVMLHTFLDHLVQEWRHALAMQGQVRQQAGYAPLPDLDVLWGGRDVLHVNALAALDGPPATGWTNVRHGGPVLWAEPRATTATVTLPWADDDPTPLVLLSFSTVPQQANAATMQSALDALGDLPVHVLGSTASAINPDDLVAPPNAFLARYVDHDWAMDRASVVLGHGGHGTTMRALSHGLPIAGIPAGGLDQARITELVQEWGAGRALPHDADTEAIHDAVTDVLTHPRYAARAGSLARDFVGVDGPGTAADSVESVMTGPLTSAALQAVPPVHGRG